MIIDRVNRNNRRPSNMVNSKFKSYSDIIAKLNDELQKERRERKGGEPKAVEI